MKSQYARQFIEFTTTKLRQGSNKVKKGRVYETISQLHHENQGQELMVQRLSGVPACVLAGYSGVLSAIPFVESRDEEEARDRKVVRVAACNYQRIFTLA